MPVSSPIKRLALVVGGGPAPGINGVISAVTIEATNRGIDVIGIEDARHHGTAVVRNLAEDARTTSRWYIVVSMGRAAGHLALGIGKSAAATLTIIPEEFRGRQVTLDELCDILLGAIIKRRSQNSHY